MTLTLLSNDVRIRLGERRTWGIAGFFLLSVVVAPKLLEKPPPHLLEVIVAWFGTADPFGLFMYLWTDLAMNKAAVLTGVVLGSGILVQERAQRTLVLWWSKPVTPSGWFLVRATSAALVAAGVYVAAHLLGLAVFGCLVAGFKAGPYLLSMAVHAGAVVFATWASALVAALVGRQLPAALASVLGLFSLVGAAFLGAYMPAWAGVIAWNPFTQAVSVVLHLGDLRAGRVLLDVVSLWIMNFAVLSAGALAARRIEA